MGMEREYQFIRYENLGKIGRIFLNRPEISNAISEQMLQDLAGENDCIAHRTDVTLQVFNKASIRGAKAIMEAKNKGFKPQKAPFEPLG